MNLIAPRRCYVERAGHVIEGFQNNNNNNNSGDDDKLKLKMIGTYIPKQDPEKPLGEDAHFILEEQGTMGVADGVGGWVRHGIDAGVYARDLMRNAMLAVEREPKGFVDPRRVLNEAFLNTTAQGSSTASIVTLKKNLLHGVNVGDCRLMLFRNNKCIFKSPIQQHRFNKPYQLGNSEKSDRPDSSEEYQVCVEAGDIVVFGSDGLWDNMHAGEIEIALWQLSLGIVDIHDLIEYISHNALSISKQKNGATPFALAAQREGFDYKGGKIDDITVLVAQIITA